MRDHLFISYATEDWLFVEWLTLRLTAEGYKVWCDRIELLGGESYPKDIDEAIKNRTFRFIAVLSTHSINKPNPVKERTLALNLARERTENFVVPINLDGLSTTDLGWMVSDLTFLPFHLSWADGLKQLLKLLEKAAAPREFVNGRSSAANWFEPKGLVTPHTERLWSNVAEITELPKNIYRYEAETNINKEQRLELLTYWPHSYDRGVFWAFENPPLDFGQKYRFKERGKIEDWQSARSKDISVRQVAVVLLNECLKSLCLARGLKITPDENLCYFPDGLLDRNWLVFQTYDDSRTRVRTVGVRNFRKVTGTESCRYHLAPSLRVWLDHELGNLVHLQVRLFLTMLDGEQLEEKPALSRRKSICRAWWNYEWLSRVLAIFQFLSSDGPMIQIGKYKDQKIVISKHPIAAEIGRGLDESLLGAARIETEEDEKIILPDPDAGREGEHGGSASE